MLSEVNYVFCDICRCKVEKGIFSMLEHLEEKHGIRDRVSLFMAMHQKRENILTDEKIKSFTNYETTG